VKYFKKKLKITNKMKKLFIVLAVASLGFVACNNEAEKTETTDTTPAPVETPAATPAPDTMKKDTGAVVAPAGDTTAKK
jgi:hypothetical protein